MVTVKFRMKDGSIIGVRIHYKDAIDIESKLGNPKHIFEITSGGVHHSLKAVDIQSMSIDHGGYVNIATGNARVGIQIGG